MTADDAALVAMLAAVETLLGDPAGWERPGPGRRSVGLAVIEAVWSIGVRYQSVDRVIERYRAERLATGGDPDKDAPADVRRVIEAGGGPEAFADRMGNRQRTSTRNGILKAEAVLREAAMLEEEGIATRGQLTRASQRRLDHLRARWCTVPGQGSGVSWRAFALGLGLPEVKPDRMIRRFVAAALGRPGEATVKLDEARDLVIATAARLGISPRALDHAIWSHQSGG